MSRSKRSARYRLLRSWALRSRDAQTLLHQLGRAIETWTGTMLSKGLKNGEKEALSIDLYDASFRPENDHDGLYPWEQRWFARRLPPVPASLLVGAAGAGREAVALRDLGYDVHAFEPSTSAFRLCRETLGPENVDQASYADLIATVLRGEETPLGFSRDREFDAVLLGWGSFGHLLQAEARFELLRACDRLTPKGPILLSVFHPKAGRSTGETVYTPWGGFLAQPRAEELERHAKALNRDIIVSLEDRSAYATLR